MNLRDLSVPCVRGEGLCLNQSGVCENRMCGVMSCWISFCTMLDGAERSIIGLCEISSSMVRGVGFRIDFPC